MELVITGDNKKYVEKYFGKLESLTDKDCYKIVEDLGELEQGDSVVYASWSDEESIYYEVESDDTERTDDVERGWNESYLNSIGMSMKDFV